MRNDVERLRGLGYPVHGIRGVTGGYRLGAGATLPPLLLDDEEAVAVAVGLRTVTGVAGFEDSGARALTKLEHVLPDRLRRHVASLRDHSQQALDVTDEVMLRIGAGHPHFNLVNHRGGDVLFRRWVS